MFCSLLCDVKATSPPHSNSTAAPALKLFIGPLLLRPDCQYFSQTTSHFSPPSLHSLLWDAGPHLMVELGDAHQRMAVACIAILSAPSWQV
eukprot:1137602-Pelagomonas_calceolata.AAC.4